MLVVIEEHRHERRHTANGGRENNRHNTLRKNGGSIPGIRAGKATSDYLRNACHSLAGSGAFVLSVIACVPILATAVTGLNMHFGGTSLLIVTGVTLEVIDSLNSHLVVRHHKGFLN